MEPNFVIVKSPDPISILIDRFPELYAEVEDLQQDEEYGAYYVYNRFADWLVSIPEDQQLWQRAYDFFEVFAKGDAGLQGLLIEVFESLFVNNALMQNVKANIGPTALQVFNRMMPTTQQ